MPMREQRLGVADQGPCLDDLRSVERGRAMLGFDYRYGASGHLLVHHPPGFEFKSFAVLLDRLNDERRHAGTPARSSCMFKYDRVR